MIPLIIDDEYYISYKDNIAQKELYKPMENEWRVKIIYTTTDEIGYACVKYLTGKQREINKVKVISYNNYNFTHCNPPHTLFGTFINWICSIF